MFLSNLFGKNHVRKKLLKQTHSAVMKDFLSIPFPGKNELILDSNIISVDFETTGLDLNKDNIVSIGAVDIVNMGIELGSSIHQLVSSDDKLTSESVIIHNITDNHLLEGISVSEALAELLGRLKGKVLLAHNARIEMGFLNRLCRKYYDTDFIMPVIDTQQLARRRFERQNKVYRSNELRLFNLRKALNMPAYRAHNSLMDAIATAELFLAMANGLSVKNDVRLKDCLS